MTLTNVLEIKEKVSLKISEEFYVHFLDKFVSGNTVGKHFGKIRYNNLDYFVSKLSFPFKQGKTWEFLVQGDYTER